MLLLRELTLEDAENLIDAEVPSCVNVDAHGSFEKRKLIVESSHPLRANLVFEKVRQTLHPVVYLVLAAGAAEEDATTGLNDGEEGSIVDFLVRIVAFGVFVDPVLNLFDTLLDASVHSFGGVFEGVAVGNFFAKLFAVRVEFLYVVERRSPLARPVMMSILGVALKREGFNSSPFPVARTLGLDTALVTPPSSCAA